MDQVENSGNEIVHINEWAVGYLAVLTPHSKYSPSLLSAVHRVH
jgi:hypothetical protein